MQSWKDDKRSSDIMVLLDGCPPSICSVHCFINSIKPQASWGRTLSSSIYLNLTLHPSPSILAGNLPVCATNSPLVPSSATRPASIVRGNITKDIKNVTTVHRSSTQHCLLTSFIMTWSKNRPRFCSTYLIHECLRSLLILPKNKCHLRPNFIVYIRGLVFITALTSQIPLAFSARTTGIYFYISNLWLS